ncbi:MAG: 2-hydroxyacyl-CoA dehydratase [Candidatus Sericytochromatia bacterium]|nr:2-hydroxyacyl-CoA dehydratase [Candidatus Tanganyikabacteria bacterium]
MSTVTATSRLESVRTFQRWFENKHEYAREWKERTGGQVVGTFCTYVPEEFLLAAGMLPARILGSHEPQAITEPHIFGMFCPFCRDGLAQGLKGRYNYVDAIVLSHSCLHFRQAFTSWKQHLPVAWSYYLPMPNAVQSPHAREAFAAEVRQFQAYVEEQAGRQITAEGLAAALETMDSNRRKLRQVYEWRKQEDPAITGTDAVYMAVTSQFIHKEDHNRALDAVLAELESLQGPRRRQGVRLMAVGSENDDVEFFRMVEALDATVVIDEQCAGSRYFWNESQPAGPAGTPAPLGEPGQAVPGTPEPTVPFDDLVVRIANRYLDRPPCPTKDYPERKRLGHVLQLARDWDVKGAIIMQEKFCDPHEADNPALRKHLTDNGIPTLLLEFDSTNPMGPLQVRVEAFLETLGEEDLF